MDDYDNFDASERSTDPIDPAAEVVRDIVSGDGDYVVIGNPEPPIRADADLRQIPDIPIEIEAIRTLASNMSAEAFRAAVLLWCAAWHEVPAGSLPDDDHHIAAVAGLALDDAWVLTKAQALTGFTLHSDDGRLYHPVITEKAITVLAEVEKRERRKADDRRRQKAHYDRKKAKQTTPEPAETSRDVGDRQHDATSAAPAPSPPPMGTAPSPPNEPATSCGDPVRDAKPHALNGQAAPAALAGPQHEIMTKTDIQPNLTIAQWEAEVQKYRVHGTWSWRSLGPSPRFPKCRAPSFILAK